MKTHAKYSPLRYASMLLAITPVVYDTDWIFYLNSALIILFFIAALIGAIQVYRKDRSSFLKYIVGRDRQDAIYDVVIGISALMICYSMGIPKLSFIWWILLASATLEFLWPSEWSKEG